MHVCFVGQELVVKPLSTTQIKAVGSTWVLTCQVTASDSGEEDVEYSLTWTAFTDGALTNINARTGRFVGFFCSFSGIT